MSADNFTFKQFRIEQERCAMKVGTDGCLLGAWADISAADRILDVGCGSGLLAIMAAQRSAARITGVEIDSEAARQAAENAARSPWGNRIDIVCGDILEYSPREAFDAIISNPPFFKNSLKCPDKERRMARHDDTLNSNTLTARAAELLRDGGTLSVVIPIDILSDWCDNALFKGLSVRRITHVHTLPHKPVKRALVEFIKGAYTTPLTNELILEEFPGIYSEAARNLLRDFYLKIQ